MSTFALSKKFSAPLLAVVLMVVGSSFFTTFLTLLLHEREYSQWQIALLQSAYFFGMLLGSFKMEDLIRKIGHIQALTTFGSLGTCAVLLQAIYPLFWVWMGLRFIVGLSLAALFIVIESWLLHYSTNKTRGVIMSLYMISITLSQVISQQLLQFINLHGFMPFLISALFTSLSVIPVSLSTERIQLPPNPEVLKLSKILKISFYGVLVCFATGLLSSTIYTFFPLLGAPRGISSENLMAVTLAGGLFLQWPIGKLSDIIDRRKSVVFTTLAAILLSLFALFTTDMPPLFFLSLCFLLGGMIFTLYPLSVSLVCDYLKENEFTSAVALLLVVYGTASVLGPLTSSLAIAYGINMLFAYIALTLSVLFGVGVYAILKSPVPLEERPEFVPLQSTTPIALEIDPRVDE